GRARCWGMIWLVVSRRFQVLRDRGSFADPTEVFVVRVLVTGAAGFIGSNIAKRFAADGHHVTAADSFLSASWTNLIQFNGDVLTLSDPEDVTSMRRTGPFDVMFHQASITGVIGSDGSAAADPHRMMRNNVETFRALL